MKTRLRQLLATLRRRRLDRELDGEIQAHLELAEREAAARGLSRGEARLEALRQFGGIAKTQEDHRDARSAAGLENFLRDFKQGMSGLRRDPVFALIAVGVLALGIGANTAMFSLLDAALLRPLPFPAPERMVKVWEGPEPNSRNSVNTLDFLDWKRMSNSFDALAAESAVSVTLTGQGEPQRLEGMRVSANYFQVFGTMAQLGRTFTAGEDEPGAEPVILLGNAAWQSRFGGDPEILARKLVLNGQAHRIAGVLPPGAFDRTRIVFWKPLIFTPALRTRDFHWLLVSGRLRAGVTIDQARQEMAGIDRRLSPLTAYWKRKWGVNVEPFSETLVEGRLRQSIRAAFGAVVLVLLMACANVANLLLAKGAARAKEMAVRTALGASRGRLLAQLLTETMVLCFAAALAGTGVAYLLISVAAPLFGTSLPFTADVRLDPRVLAFTAVSALAVTLTAGLLPSLQVSLHGIAVSMNRGSRGTPRGRERTRRLLVAGEVGLSFVLICGALLLLKTLANLQAVNTGIRMDGVIAMPVELPLSDYPAPETATRFFRSVEERLRGIPGVAAVSVATDAPLVEVREGMALLEIAGDKAVDIRYKRVGPDYFRAVGISMASGRGIARGDRPGAPRVMVINQALAGRITRQFGLANPVGQRVRVVTPDWVKLSATLEATEIVGVIRSELTGDPRLPESSVAYLPLDQVPSRRVNIIVRTGPDQLLIAPQIRKAVWEVDHNMALGEVRTIQQIRQEELAGAIQPAAVIGAFALMAVLLAALGLYGVLSHAVTQQRKEIGIRLALGAAPGKVMGEVIRKALSMIAVGLCLGLAGAFGLTRVVQSLLFQVPALDPMVLACGCAAMMIVGLSAAFVPSLRASRIEPLGVLREDG